MTNENKNFIRARELSEDQKTWLGFRIYTDSVIAYVIATIIQDRRDWDIILKRPERTDDQIWTDYLNAPRLPRRV